eukprot:g2788.t1
MRRMDHGPGGGRHYKVEGQAKAFPSVTSILNKVNKPGLQHWAVAQAIRSLQDDYSAYLEARADEGGVDVVGADDAAQRQFIEDFPDIIARAQQADKRALREAARIGTEAHEAVDVLVRGEEPDITSDVVGNVVEGFRRWQRDTDVVVDPRGDTRVYSERYRYAGAMDAVGVDPDGNAVVIDFKTSKQPYDTHAMQVAAYAHAVEEMTAGRGHPVAVSRAVVIRLDKDEPLYEEHAVDLVHSFNAFKAALHLWSVDHAAGRCLLWEDKR